MFLSVFIRYILYMISNPSYEKQINKKEWVHLKNIGYFSKAGSHLTYEMISGAVGMNIS